MGELKKVTAKDLLGRKDAGLMAQSAAYAVPEVDDERWALREAAALLGAFEAGSLRPRGTPPDDAALQAFVVRDCERIVTPTGSRWSLQRNVRADTIRRLGTPERMVAALGTRPPDPSDLGRLMAEAYLRGEAKPVEEQDVDELNGTLRAIDWLSATPVQLPDAGRVHQQIARARLMESLEVLAGEHFVGRRAELRRLADYVGVPVEGRARAVAHRLRDSLRRNQKPPLPLLVHGPAGVGKSALVARFILDHRVDLGWFAYLSLDRADVSAQQPLTLLAEAARQMVAQYPAAKGPAQDLEHSVAGTVTSLALLEGDVGKAATASIDPCAWSSRDENWHIGQFADLVEAATHGAHLPALWVVDDLENAQREGPVILDRLWRFLQELQSRVPRLRVVLIGAASLPDYPVESLPLLAFDPEISTAYVEQVSPDLKVSDVLRVAANRSDQLTLRLAVEVLHREHLEHPSWSVESRQSGLELDSEDIRATLYLRILDHLADPELRSLVYPSLALRRITPAVIKDVLAVPAGLHDIDDERARMLFDSLEAEAFLVARIDRADAVTHRRDIRAVMLPLLQRERPDVVAAIHRRAVTFYRKIEGVEARTEELYHRLAMGQSTETLDKHWDADAGRQLEVALDELPPAGRAYLADRLNLPVDPATLAEADTEAWIRQVGRIGRELLDAMRPREALDLLEQRGVTPAHSPVTSLRVEALAMLGRVREALELAEQSLRPTAEESESGAFVRLALVGARVAEDQGKFDRALTLASHARDLAQASGDRIDKLATGVAELRLLRRSGADDADTVSTLRTNMIAECKELGPRDRPHHPSLIRDLAAELGDAVPELVLEATRLVGIGIEGEARETLRAGLTEDDRSDFVSFVQSTEGAPGGEAPSAKGTESFLRDWRMHNSVAHRSSQLSAYLEQEDTRFDTWKEALTRMYRSEADKPAFGSGAAETPPTEETP